MIKIILISIALLSLAIAGIAIKMFFKKDYQFEKKCTTVDPKSGKTISVCSCGDSGACNNENNNEDEQSSIKIEDINLKQ